MNFFPKPDPFFWTDDGSPTLIDDINGQMQHSYAGAWGEALHVFAEPIKNNFHHLQSINILDIGFGLGMNWMAVVDTALENNIHLKILSLEKNENLLKIKIPQKWIDNSENEPLGRKRPSLNLKKAIYGSKLPRPNWPALPVKKPRNETINLRHKLCDENKVDEKNVLSSLIVCDASTFFDSTNKKFIFEFFGDENRIHAVIHDPYSWQHNTELWSDSFFRSLRPYLEKNAVLFTYSVARKVCDALKNAGFSVEKKSGFANKRNRLEASVKENR